MIATEDQEQPNYRQIAIWIYKIAPAITTLSIEGLWAWLCNPTRAENALGVYVCLKSDNLWEETVSFKNVLFFLRYILSLRQVKNLSSVTVKIAFCRNKFVKYKVGTASVGVAGEGTKGNANDRRSDPPPPPIRDKGSGSYTGGITGCGHGLWSELLRSVLHAGRPACFTGATAAIIHAI